VSTLIAVVNYRQPESTARCVRSLIRVEGDFSILVVDNSASTVASDQLRLTLSETLEQSHGEIEESTAGENQTWKLIPRHHAPPICVAVMSTNGGYAAACNWAASAAQQAGKTFVWLLNNDLVVDSGSLAMLRETMAAAPTVALLGVTIRPLQQAQRSSVAGVPRFSRALGRSSFIRVSSTTPMVLPDARRVGPVTYVAGAAMFARVSALQAVGGLDESYFLYCEELDLCERLRRAGYRVGIEPRAVVHHLGGLSTGSTTQKSRLTAYCASRAAIRCVRRHWPTFLPAVTIARTFYAVVLATHSPTTGAAAFSGVISGLRDAPPDVDKYQADG